MFSYRNIFKLNIITSSILFIFSTSNSFADVTYNGNPADLESRTSLGKSTNWMDLPAIAPGTTGDGVIYNNSGYAESSTTTNIDFSGTNIPSFVIGGFNTINDTNIVENNTVNLTKGQVEGSVYGGFFSYALETAGVTISSSYPLSNSASADAGFSVAKTPLNPIVAQNNEVNVTDNFTVSGSIYGGVASVWIQSGNADASGAKAAATGAAKAGAYANVLASDLQISADNNSVFIGESSHVDSLYGGVAQFFGIAGEATGGKTITATIIGYRESNAEAVANVDMYNSKLTANSNVIKISKATVVNNSIYGGYVSNKALAGKATGGTENLEQGGIQARISSSRQATGSASVNAYGVTMESSENTIIFDGNLNGDIYGGYLVTDYRSGTGTTDESVSFNGDAATGKENSTLSAQNNSINITENATISSSSSIYGGYYTGTYGDKSNTYLGELGDIDKAPAYYNLFSGNELSISSAPITVSNLGNFEHYNFYLTDKNVSTVFNNGTPSGTGIITVTNKFINNDTAKNDGTATGVTKDYNVANVQLSGISGDGLIGKGQSVTLLDVTGATLTQDSYTTNTGNTVSLDTMVKTPVKNTVNVGLVGTADVTYETTAQKVIATIDDIRTDKERVNINGKPLAESYLASLMNVTRGADDLFNLMDKHKPIGTFMPLAMISGGINKYNSGSYIDTRDYRLMVGSRYQFFDNLYGGFTLDYGRSNFDTHNSSRTGDIEGDGHTYNYGVTLFSKYSHYFDVGNMYVDAAFRFGRTNTEFKSNDIILGSGDRAHYKSKVNYIGGLVGTGYIYPIDDNSSFDTSVRYFYTRLGSDSVVLDGDKVNFRKATSSRIQFKEQYDYITSDNLTLSLAGIYEYEFNGKANANISGFAVDAPSVKGSTGIMELGILANPVMGNKDFTINLKFRGYGGKRDGASATALFEYSF